MPAQTNSSSRLTIQHTGSRYDYAAKELAAYLAKITGERPILVKGDELPSKCRSVFVVGAPSDNPLAGALDKSLDGAISKALSPRRGFVVCPVKRGQTRCVVLAGETPVTTLYAVYAYLEEFCHVGFFQDGEYVPKIRPLLEGEPLVSRPRFLDRQAPFSLGRGHWGLKKFYPRFWTRDEIRRELQWMAKRRQNMLTVAMSVVEGAAAEMAREVCDDIGCPIGEPEEKEAHVSGFSMGWSWPCTLRTELMRESIEYGRKLGIRFIYGLSLGQVPLEFKAKYRQFKYIKVEGTRWEHPILHPDDPLCREFTARHLRKIIETFGTDHMYFGFPYGETSREKTPGENFELKKKAAMQFMDLLKEVDREAIWATGSWDFFWSRDTWTPTRVKRFLDAIPDDSFHISDTNSDNRGIPVYAEHNYFHGKDWSFGVMHSAAGMDQIHGDFPMILDRLKHVAKSRRAKHCRGVSLVPELTHYNVMYYDFLTSAAWDPVNIDIDDYIDDFVLRRYGFKSARVMRKATDKIVEALYTREVNTPIYNLATIKWIWHNAAPCIQRHTVPRLYLAVTEALKERSRQENNRLYENDIVTYGKAYLAELAAYHFHNANDAYAAGDVDLLKEEAARCLHNVEWIARILSTRRDYSIARMIDDVMKVPGTNRYTPRMILKGCVNWDYCSNDSYEQVANYDLPRLSNYFKLLEQQADHTPPPIDMWSTVENLAPTHDDWVNGKATLKRRVVFRGSAVDAVVEAVKCCSAAAGKEVVRGEKLRFGRRIGWRADLDETKHWEVGRKGARMKGGVISSDPALSPMGSYMHKEWVDMPFWGTVRTSRASGLSSVDLHETPLLRICYRIEEGRDPIHLWAKWRGASRKTHRTRVWRSFARRGKWTTDTIDLLHALRSHGEEPKKLLSLEFGTQRVPHEIRIGLLEIRNPLS